MKNKATEAAEEEREDLDAGAFEFEPDWEASDVEASEESTAVDFESCAKLRYDMAPQDPFPSLRRYRGKGEAPFEMGAFVPSGFTAVCPKTSRSRGFRASLAAPSTP